MRIPPSLVAGFVLWMCSAFGFAQAQVQAKHAHVELLSTPLARNEVQLGLHFRLEKGWHIYWVNPGDSGQPPSFSWSLPSGATAGEIEWPRPERLQSSPAIVDYGYKDDVLLMVPVHFPDSVGKSTVATIGLEAKWLICREVCLPDHTQLSLSFPAASSGSPRTAELFARAKALLPQQWPSSWKARAESRKDDFALTLIAGRSITRAQFFPLDPGQIENAAKPRIIPTRNGARLLLRKSDLLLKPIQELRGVVVIGAQAYRLRAPVVAVALK